MVVFVFFAGESTLLAQNSDATSTPVSSTNPYGSGIGMGIALNNSGFGINGFITRALTPTLSLTTELSIRSEKHEQEQKFFDFFGNSLIPYKLNYMLMIPLEVGVQKRVFADAIEDSFRPFVQASAGPTIGYIYPYFNDDNQNMELDQGEKTFDSIGSLFKGLAEFGIGGSIGFGAQFGISRKSVQAIRLGYNFQYFFKDIQLMEPSFKDAQHFFGTPTITLIFGRTR